MKLQTKVYVFILIAWILMLIVVVACVKNIIITNYLELENKLASNAALRINEAIEQKIVAVEGTVITWAVWDDAYRFAVGQNPGFVDQVFTPASMATANVDIALVYSPDGKIVSQKMLNTERTAFIAIPKELDQALLPEGALWQYISNKDEKFSIKGLYPLNDKVLMIAARAILTNEGKGPSHGNFFVAKWFTANDWKEIREATKINADIHYLNDIKTNNKLNTKYQTILKSNSTLLLERNNKDTLTEYSIIKDINNHPIALIKITLPRDVYKEGIRSIYNFLFLFIALGFLIAIILSFLIRRILILKLEKINKEITFVGKTKNFSVSIPFLGHDEVSSLGNAVNKLFSIVWDYDKKNKTFFNKLNEELDQSTLLSKELKEAEQFLIDIINSMPSCLIIVDEKQKIIQINKACEQAFNLNPESVKGRSIFEVLPFVKQYQVKFEEVTKTGHAQDFHKIIVKNQDGVKYFNMSIFKLSNEQSLGIRFDDVTDLINLQSTMTQNEKLATIGLLTSGVASDINPAMNTLTSIINPLNKNIDSIFAYIKKYLNPAEDAVDFSKNQPVSNYLTMIEDTNKMLDDIYKNGTSIAEIVKTLQAFTHMDENTLKDYDIHEGLEITLKLLTHRLKDKIKVIKTYEKIPHIKCYPGKMNQVFISLISNAIDSMEDEGGTLTIATKMAENRIYITINDTGVGMDAETVNSLFDHTETKNEHRNVEMKLSSVHDLIREIHGKIKVKSEVGKGSEFIIVIPLNGS